MTLLVTERSPLGILMLADTLAQVEGPAGDRRVPGIGKIVYNRDLNVALGGWGRATINEKRLDIWLAEFLASANQPGCSVRELGVRLVGQANAALEKSGKSWAALGRRGVHIAGFENEFPVLYHAHMGPDEGPVGPLVLEDTVAVAAENGGYSLDEARKRGTTQLRSGIWPRFVEAWDRDVGLSGWGDFSDLAARAEHYRPLFKAVAHDTPLIDDQISLIALSPTGPELEALVTSRTQDMGAAAWSETISFAAL